MTTNRETLKEAGYSYVKALGHRMHLLQNDSGNYEVWACSKNHAGYALVYKNTHLEFCSRCTSAWGVYDTRKGQ